MKKTAVLAALLLVSTPAAAQVYLGGTYHYTKSDKDKDILPSSAPQGAAVHVGYLFNRNFSAELGYEASSADSKDMVFKGVTGTSKLDVRGPTLDAYGYLPLGRTGFSPLVTAGVVYQSWKPHFDMTSNVVGLPTSENKIGFRGGAGFEWWIGGRFGLRAVVRYEDAATKGVIGDVGFDFAL